MKKTHVLSIIGLTVLLTLNTGCISALFPKQVEFGQRKVKPVPVLGTTAVEHQRQAAQFVADRALMANTIAQDQPTDLLLAGPLRDASQVATALTESEGPPAYPWDDTAQSLVDILHRDQAKHNSAVQKYATTVQEDVGKKIEGTGIIRMGYFTYVGCFLLLGALVWAGLKIYGMVNPVVGLGVNTVGSVASSVLSKGFSELVAGGEAFKNYVVASPLAADVKDYVLDLFTRAHTSNQSSDVQTVVTGLTAQDQPGTVQPIPPLPTSPPPAVALNIAPVLQRQPLHTASGGGLS